MKEKLFEFGNYCVAGLIVITIIFIAFYLIWFVEEKNENLAKQMLIQKLCNKKQYDFCEVDKVVYKYKELKDD